jgi:hypothetical protein
VYDFGFRIPACRCVQGEAGDGAGASWATDDPGMGAKEDPAEGRAVVAPIIGTATETDSSRAELATGDSSWGSTARLAACVRDGIMWSGAPGEGVVSEATVEPGNALSGACGSGINPEATLESGTGAYTSIRIEPCCSCTGISGNDKTDTVGSLDSLVKILSHAVDDGISKTSEV